MKAKDIMNKNVISVKGTDKIEFVTKVLLQNRISGVPVVDSGNNVIGIVSESDLIFKAKDVKLPYYLPLLGGYILLDSIKKFENELVKMSAYKVEQVMNKSIIKVCEETEVSEVTETLVKERINRVPVVDENDKLVGIITRSDILKSF